MLAEDADNFSVDRSLEAYLLWLFGYVMFNNSHGDSVDRVLMPYARESQMLRMMTSLRGVGVRQCLLPCTVASVTPARRTSRTPSSPDARCCCSYGHTRGSQSAGPSSTTVRIRTTFTGSSTMTGPRWGLSGAAVRYVCERYFQSLIFRIHFFRP